MWMIVMMMMMIVAIIMNYEDDEDLVVVDKEEDVSGDFDNYGDGGDMGEQSRREPACRR